MNVHNSGRRGIVATGKVQDQAMYQEEKENMIIDSFKKDRTYWMLAGMSSPMHPHWEEDKTTPDVIVSCLSFIVNLWFDVEQFSKC